MTKLNYRPEIDGLRAIAVIAVILFHLDFSQFSGGYVGVDIFFTISGYLITGIIFKSSLKYTYLLKFYANRFWRLYPSLLTICFLSTLISILIFPPDLTNKTVKSAISSVTFTSNFYFYLDTGYWDFTSKFKPLLHTWSLGVEEQFYLLYPLLLIFLSKSAFNNFYKIYIIIIIISLSLTIFATNINPNFAFFMSPFRLYEFMLGGLAWIISKKSNLRVSIYLKEFLIFISLLVIVISIITYGKLALFPSGWALIPCLACSIILLSEKSKISKLFLASKPQIYLGKLSYTLYLVHWPVIVFLTYHTQLKLTFFNKILSVVLTLIISVLISKLIEAPYRYNRTIKQYIFITLITFTFLITIYFHKEINVFLNNSNPVSKLTNLPGKYVNLQRHKLKVQNCDESSISDGSCNAVSPDKKNVLIVGDSHAIDGYNIFKNAYPNISFLLMGERGCPHLLNGDHHNTRKCKTNFNDVRDFLNNNKIIDTVIYSIRMDLDKLSDLVKTTEYLSSNHYKVIILGVGPWFNQQVRITAHKFATLIEAQKAVKKTQKENLFEINEIAKRNINVSGGFYIDKLEYFCPSKICNIYTENKSEMVTYDRNHLSYTAAKEFGLYLQKTYRNLLNE